MDATRRCLLLALGAGAGLAGCAGLAGPPRLRFGERELAAMLERHFPLERRLLEVIDVEVRTPRLRLLPERNRIAARVDIGTRDRLFGSRLNGELDFDSALRFQARDQTLRLDQVRVQDLKVAGSGGDARTPFERLGAALAERVLEGMVLYTLPAERAEQLRRAGLAPGAVTVTSGGVEVELIAARA